MQGKENPYQPSQSLREISRVRIGTFWSSWIILASALKVLVLSGVSFYSVVASQLGIVTGDTAVLFSYLPIACFIITIPVIALMITIKIVSSSKSSPWPWHSYWIFAVSALPAVALVTQFTLPI